MIKIHYSHLCEKAFLSQNGNLNLIGIFENITSQTFPVTFPQLALVTSLEGEVGQHQLSIKVINVESQQEISKTITLNLNIEPNAKNPEQKPGNVRIIGDINNLNIQETGKYEVQLHLNGNLAYTIPFTANTPVKPIPENR